MALSFSTKSLSIFVILLVILVLRMDYSSDIIEGKEISLISSAEASSDTKKVNNELIFRQAQSKRRNLSVKKR